MRIEYHRTLIADGVRNQALHDALKAVIKPGETTVADIGAGTGLIGLMAENLGARRVYLYEAGEVAGVAHEVLRGNGAKRCELIACHSTEMIDPPRVDVVVSETLGNYAFEEDIISTLRDAVRRHLKPGGIIVPSRVVQSVAPVIVPRVHDELCAWERVGFGIDFAAARGMSFNNIYVRTFQPDELLDKGGAAVVWDDVDLVRSPSNTRRGEALFSIEAPVVLYGFAAWWRADLHDGIALDTAPGAAATHWEQLYLPLPEPITAAVGDAVSIALRSRTSAEAGTVLKWTVGHRNKDGLLIKRQSLDLERGYLA